MSSGGKLASSFGNDMADMMYDTGKHAGEGFLAGLKARRRICRSRSTSWPRT
jgi:hypothetical protein